MWGIGEEDRNPRDLDLVSEGKDGERRAEGNPGPDGSETRSESVSLRVLGFLDVSRNASAYP